MRLTKPQQQRLYSLWQKLGPGIVPYPSYRAFRRTVRPLIGGDGCVMVRWCGMWIGIEEDGHAHS